LSTGPQVYKLVNAVLKQPSQQQQQQQQQGQKLPQGTSLAPQPRAQSQPVTGRPVGVVYIHTPAAHLSLSEPQHPQGLSRVAYQLPAPQPQQLQQVVVQGGSTGATEPGAPHASGALSQSPYPAPQQQQQQQQQRQLTYVRQGQPPQGPGASAGTAAAGAPVPPAAPVVLAPQHQAPTHIVVMQPRQQVTCWVPATQVHPPTMAATGTPVHLVTQPWARVVQGGVVLQHHQQPPAAARTAPVPPQQQQGSAISAPVYYQILHQQGAPARVLVAGQPTILHTQQ
jgi:hypothetical protein